MLFHKASPVQSDNQSNKQLRTYAATFCGGYTAGVTGELLMLGIDGKLSVGNVLSPTFGDACTISGIQQVAKDFSKNTLKKNPTFLHLSKTNPLIFGASTGLPMWFLTRIFATPIQNGRKEGQKSPYAGFWSSVAADAGYHTCKNGIDEYFNQRVFPKLLPRLPNFASQKAVESTIAGMIGAGCYVISWPYKTVVAGQSFDQAVKLMNRNFPKVVIKKITYTLARPQYGKLIEQ